MAAEVRQAPAMSQMGAGQVALTALRSGDDLLFVIRFERSPRFEIVVFEAYGGYESEAIGANIARMQQTIIQMFEGLQFVSEGVTSLMPGPGPLSGVWWGTYLAQTFEIDLVLKFEIDHR